MKQLTWKSFPANSSDSRPTVLMLVYRLERDIQQQQSLWLDFPTRARLSDLISVTIARYAGMC